MTERAKQLERAELHAHLGSSVSVELLWDLSHEQGIRLPVRDFDAFKAWITMWETDKNVDIKEMDEKYFHWTELIQSSPAAVEKAIKSTIWTNYRKSNLTLQEIRFNPMFRNKKWEIDLDYIIVSAIHGLDYAMLQYDKVKAWIILCMDRRLSFRKNKIIVGKAIKYKNRGIVWIDLSWPQNESFDMKEHKELFDLAKKEWLWVTIHTWEEWQLEELRYVVEVIKPHRIWHGIMAAQDQKIIDGIVKNDIVLEICPTSNLKNSKTKNIEELSSIIKTFLKNEVKITLNTDWAVMYQINIIKEEDLLLNNNIITEIELNQMYKNAFDYSFVK